MRTGQEIASLRRMSRLPHVKASGEGRVINFASLAGVIGLQGYAPYNMVKEAVRALTPLGGKGVGR